MYWHLLSILLCLSILYSMPEAGKHISSRFISLPVAFLMLQILLLWYKWMTCFFVLFQGLPFLKPWQNMFPQFAQSQCLFYFSPKFIGFASWWKAESKYFVAKTSKIKMIEVKLTILVMKEDPRNENTHYFPLQNHDF